MKASQDLSFLEKLPTISTFVFDVDGVLTNGQILMLENGEALRSFNIKDGYALQLAAKKGYRVAIISGGKGASMENRFRHLGIPHVFLGVSDKVAVLKTFLDSESISAEEVLYMGDDIPDLQVMKMVGLATCPADAVPEIQAISAFVSPYAGGATAVRDIIERVLKVQNNWQDHQPDAAASSI